MNLLSLMAVFIGGGVGSVLRYVAGRLLPASSATAFPWGTFAVNAAGCLLIGVVASAAPHIGMRGECRALLQAGLCGGLTTFSTFSRELFDQLSAGAFGAAALYLVASLAVGLTAVALGYFIGARMVG